ncbi:LOW QUALITY PROTEIN: hypothetical protein TorRG33x02_239600 [Trema orientale]|uniref:Uncharacterized protein n=1 Tax=Trema orientale TaxID=63057 RepID=A0A2P5DX23_TREOI|nr:LOW QUALITY PROTEIN: hypothetical protein TorRG33x02_239600 [Trema orientale]
MDYYYINKILRPKWCNDMVGLVVTSDTSPSATILVGSIICPRGENVTGIHNSLKAEESLFLLLYALPMMIPTTTTTIFSGDGHHMSGC